MDELLSFSLLFIVVCLLLLVFFVAFSINSNRSFYRFGC